MTVTCPNCRNEISVSKFMPVSVRCKKCKSVFNVEYNPDELGFWGKQKLKCNNFSIAHPNITKAAKITIGLAIAAGLTKLALDSRPESTQAGLPAESEDTASDDVSSTESNGKTPPPEEPASSDDIKPEVEPSISKTDFERHLLDRLLSGGLDSPVGSPFKTESLNVSNRVQPKEFSTVTKLKRSFLIGKMIENSKQRKNS